MNRDEIRKQTSLIIRKNGKYMVGSILYSTEIRWSLSAWDAWRTRDRELARVVARKTGGTTVLFNPITGEERAV